MECPADTGRRWQSAALCAQYVPKFRLLRCLASTLNTTAVSPSRCPYHYHDPDAARTSFQAALRISRRSGARSGIAYASLGLACLAADAGNWHRAAVLHGIAQAFLNQTGQPWEELEARYRQDSLDQVSTHLGQEQFEQARAKGMALSSDEALDLASGKGLPA